MHLELTNLLGTKIIAVDGEVGRIEDFYFDDQSWIIRFIVVDTGGWLEGREVVLSPKHITAYNRKEEAIETSLTRQQVESSPSFNAHMPISRQYEEDYYQYYNLQPYWHGTQFWGIAPYPSPVQHPEVAVKHSATISSSAPIRHPEESHLRSIRELVDYEVTAQGQTVGSVADFLVQEHNWQIDQCLIKTGNILERQFLRVLRSEVKGIDYLGSTVELGVERSQLQVLT